MSSGERSAIASRDPQPGRASKERPGRFIEVKDAAGAAEFVEAWERLAERPLERNVFVEPWFLLPALDHFKESDAARIGLAFDPKSDELGGVFPFARRNRWNHFPISVVSIWVHGQSYLGTPLLHEDPEVAKRAISRFIDAAEGAALVEFEDVSGDGVFMQLLTEVLNERQLASLRTHSITRPVLRPRQSAEDYLAAALDGDARRKLRSKEKGLAALGTVKTTAVESASDLDEWLEQYVRLEAGGWKGRLGTALVHRPEARKYFEIIAHDGFRRGRVMALTMFSGSRPVALKINLKSGNEWFAYKIAYDEELARYSPGLLLEVENIRRVHALGDVRSMDSCTGPTTRVFRDLWLDRRAIHDVTVATGPEPGPAALAMLPLIRWGKQKAKGYFPGLQSRPDRKPAPRDVAALPLASAVSLPARLLATPLALAATTFAGVRDRPGDIRGVLMHAVRLQSASGSTKGFHDRLDAFFADLEPSDLIRDLGYPDIRSELFASRDPIVMRRVGAGCSLGPLLRIAAPLSIRLDFVLLRKGAQIPPHGHSRTASGLSVVLGKLALRRYHLVENEPDNVVLRPTFDGVLPLGGFSTESDVRDNVHWLVALEETVLFRVTVTNLRSQSLVPTSLNVWVDPRAPVRGDGTILGRWVSESAARDIPPFR